MKKETFKIIFKKIIKESLDKNTFYYHGRTIDSEIFDIKYTGKGTDQEGAGFYFSTSIKDAAMYSSKNGIILKVKLNYKKLISSTKKGNKNLIKKLIISAPDYKETLLNWDENKHKALQMAINGIYDYNNTQKDEIQTIEADFYRHSPEKYLENLIKLGYDGFIIDKEDGINHFIVFNPNIIEVIDKIDIGL